MSFVSSFSIKYREAITVLEKLPSFTCYYKIDYLFTIVVNYHHTIKINFDT